LQTAAAATSPTAAVTPTSTVTAPAAPIATVTDSTDNEIASDGTAAAVDAKVTADDWTTAATGMPDTGIR